MAETGRGGLWRTIPRSIGMPRRVARVRGVAWRKRRSFVVPALAFVFVWYFGFIALAGYAPDFMGERLIDGFTVGYALALSQFVMTWVLGWLYLRKSDRVFDPLAKRAAERALEHRDGRAGVAMRGGDGPRRAVSR